MKCATMFIMNSQKETLAKENIAWTTLFFATVILLLVVIVMIPATFISVAFFDSALLLGGIISVVAFIASLFGFVLFEEKVFPTPEYVSRTVVNPPTDPHENDIFYPRQPRIFH